LQQTSDDHMEPLGTLPAIEPDPASFLNHNGGEKWADSLPLLWQIYSRCLLAQIRFRQWGHRCGGGRAMSATMA
jgi:hypothetical protein